MAASCLCDFCEILACWRWVWWGFSSQFGELRITVHPVMQKARVVEPKTQHSFVDIHKSIGFSLVGIFFCIFTIIFIVITVFSPNHTHLMNSSVTADWNGGHMVENLDLA